MLCASVSRAFKPLAAAAAAAAALGCHETPKQPTQTARYDAMLYFRRSDR